MFPAITIIFFCAAVGPMPRGLPVAVFNQDTGILLPSNTALFLSLSPAERAYWMANPSPTDGWRVVSLAQNFLDQLPSKTITQINVTSMSAGLDKARSGSCWGVYYMSPNFTLDTISRYSSSPSNESLAGDPVQLTLDNSDQQIYLTIQQVSLQAYQVPNIEILHQ